MAKIDEHTELLKQHIGEKFTTKYLIDTLGITSWYIGELTHVGVLEKEGRGVYKVLDFVKTDELPQEKNKVADFKPSKKVIVNDTRRQKGKNTGREFEIFKNLVLTNKFEDAYDALIKCVEVNKDNHDYDSHYRMYFIMLTKILKLKRTKKQLDYDYDDKLLEFYDKARTEYFANFVSFKEALLSGKFNEANTYLREYANQEFARYKENKISTVLSKHLLNQIIILQNNQRMTSKKFLEINNRLNNGKYDEALLLIQELYPYLNSGIAIKLTKYMESVCQTIIEFLNDPNLLLEEKNDYQFKGDESLAKAFSTFMDNKDYINANAYINLCCEKYKSNFFDTIKSLLSTMVNIHKGHLVNSPNQREINAKRLQTKKSEAATTIHFSRFLDALQHLDFDKALDEIEENLCYHPDPTSSTYLRNKNLYELLKFYKELKENKVSIKEPYKIYLDFNTDYFNFTTAIMNQDWISANKYFQKMDIGTSLTLEACGLILKAILRQDKINKGLELTEEDELKPLSCHLKETLSSPVDVKIDASIELPKEKLKKEEEPKEESSKGETNILKMEGYEDISKGDVLASIKNLTLNYETLYNLVKTRQFEEAYELIVREEANGYSLDEALKKMVEREEKEQEVASDESTPEVTGEETKEETQEEKHETIILKKTRREEVLESIEGMELNYKTLYDLVYEREYEKALYLLEREDTSSRLCFNAHRLISHYLHVIKGTFKLPEQKPYDYTQDCFKLFFASLNNRDYEYSLEVIDDCIEKAANSEEFELFKMVIVDIVDELRKIDEEEREKEEKEQAKKEMQEQIDSINKKVLNISNKQEIDDKDLRTLESLLNEKIEISIANGLKYDKDELVLGAVEAALMSIDGNLNDYCFADAKNTTIDDNEVKATLAISTSSISDTFYEALKCGDLLTAGNILLTTNWDNLRDKMTSINLRILKKTFIFMKEHMMFVSDKQDKRDEIEKQKVSQEVLDEIEKNSYEILDDEGKVDYQRMMLLKNLYSLIKKQKYNEALGLILESEANISESPALMDITAEILLAKEGIKEESHVIFDEFNQAMKEHNLEDAHQKLREYSGYLTSKSIERDLTYHRKRIDILEHDLKTSNFDEKERIYLDALEMLHNRDVPLHLEKTIEIINEYLELDKDINTKGYILRARAYELLKMDKEAKDDYKKSLTIAPTPNAYYALGKYAFERENYKDAINYLESYHAIRPFKSEEVSRMLAICYNYTKNKEKALVHNKYLSYMSKIKH